MNKLFLINKFMISYQESFKLYFCLTLEVKLSYFHILVNWSEMQLENLLHFLIHPCGLSLRNVDRSIFSKYILYTRLWFLLMPIISSEYDFVVDESLFWCLIPSILLSFLFAAMNVWVVVIKVSIYAFSCSFHLACSCRSLIVSCGIL